MLLSSDLYVYVFFVFVDCIRVELTDKRVYVV